MRAKSKLTNKTAPNPQPPHTDTERTPAFVQSLMSVVANRTAAGKLLKEARDSTTAMKQAAAKRSQN